VSEPDVGDDAEIEDLAAERDEAPDPQLVAAARAASQLPPTPDQLYQGTVTGGPWDGRVAQSRFPLGFLLIDPGTDRVWIYDYVTATLPGGGARFAVRAGMPQPCHDGGPDNRWRAADEGDFDVRVTDGDEPPAVMA
jgi:hypothetical protein